MTLTPAQVDEIRAYLVTLFKCETPKTNDWQKKNYSDTYRLWSAMHFVLSDNDSLRAHIAAMEAAQQPVSPRPVLVHEHYTADGPITDADKAKFEEAAKRAVPLDLEELDSRLRATSPPPAPTLADPYERVFGIKTSATKPTSGQTVTREQIKLLNDVAQRDNMIVHGPGDPFVRISTDEHAAIKAAAGLLSPAEQKEEG